MAQLPIKLSKERYMNLLTAEGKLTQYAPVLDALEQCGVDCAPMRQLIMDKLAQISAIKANFAPKIQLTDQ
jgi:hypothetical protein